MRYNIKMQVIPSIDVSKIDDLRHQIDRLKSFYKRFQIDFADGKFVKFTTPPLPTLIESLEAYNGLVFDLHLMTLDCQRALDIIETFQDRLKLNVIFIHHVANPLPKLFLDPKNSHNYGLVLSPEDEIDTIKHVYDLSSLNNLQIMSITPGPQGSPFLPDTLNKIEQLRFAGYKNKIFLDGGVNQESLKTILRQKYRPDFICPGSFFSRSKNVEESVQYLSEVLTHESNSNQNA